MNHTEIIFIIDKSGSMAHLASDTIGGFNGFVKGQQAIDGKATLTTVLFDTRWEILYDGVDIHKVKPMTTADYMAGGGTAMLDAIGETISRVQDRHDELGVEKPDKVIFVITTDGEENSSRQFTKSQIEKMIKHQTNGHGWQFMFLGGNMYAVKEAESLGINSTRATNYTYTGKGIEGVYATMDCMASAIRNDVDGIANMSLTSMYETVTDSAKTYTDSAVDALVSAITTKTI